MIFGFPVLSHPPSGFFEISCNIQVFFLPSNFWFNSTSRVTPIFHYFPFFLISSFILQIFILTINPELFKFLLINHSCWIISHVVRLSFKSVFHVVGSRLVRCVECIEWKFLHLFVIFFEFWKSWNWYRSSVRGCYTSWNTLV